MSHTSSPETKPPAVVRRTWHQAIVVVISCVLGIPLVIALTTLVYIIRFQDRVYPGVFIGAHPLGGMSRGEVKNFIRSYQDFLMTTGLSVTLKTPASVEQFKVPLPAYDSDTDSSAFIIDIETTLDRIFSIGRPSSWVGSMIEPWKLLRNYRTTTIHATLHDERIIAVVKPIVAPFEREPRNAELSITSLTPLSYKISADEPGLLVQYQELITAISERIAVASRSGVPGRTITVMPAIERADIDAFLPKIPLILGQGSLTLTYPQVTKPKGGAYSWVITEEQLADWLRVSQTPEAEIVARLEERSIGDYINAIVRPDVDQPAIDAKFSVENNRVKEFEPGQNGLSLDTTSTVRAIQDVLTFRSVGFTTTTEVPIVVRQVSSTRSLSDLNVLGIVDVLGVGSSTFKDSHTNRIKNIANAVKRLNGVLIAPGEEFSTNKYAGPYTESNGFLPEMVIKGTRIIPEVGGGMCQIGTTLFRMAMNSGMPITQRQNHSLVVSYYADPVNKNPGTDATLYEPTLDFKFLNDTGNYMLLTTDIDYKRQLLTFTVWGKSDGRSGRYEHPIVKRWIDPGKPQEILSPNAPPGSRSCQNAFRGAEATFTYTRFTSTSERIDRVFDSYYRPLPKICIVGPTSTPVVSVENSAASGAGEPIIDTIVPVGN